VRRVRPDIVVRAEAKEGKGKTLLVVDTKWKVASNGMPSDDDLKQMFVYNEVLAGTRSMLLYPATQKSFPASGSYAMKGHGCEQFHVGVLEGAKWDSASIKQQLSDLLAQLHSAA
jgi:5-methylcytosine-specific restriction enzyme subunit McrC